MWVVCKHGFFNIVCQDNDAVKGLLTIKARSKKDLLELTEGIGHGGIEESTVADYRYRVKIDRLTVINLMCAMVDKIDYPKTKPKLAEYRPHRDSIYLDTWDALAPIQYIDETV